MFTKFDPAQIDGNLRVRIAALLQRADEISREYFKRQNFQWNPPVHEADYLSEKWVRIWAIEKGPASPQSKRSYAFVALSDFSNKELGQVRTGDIHMCASWKKPAKHARGSVFADDFGNCLTEHGVKYLK